MEAFGEKLRRQREQRGITLEAISNTTKISTRMLRALEEENFEQLPGGVFNKGFIRAYARQVGLDEEEAITDYLAALHESQLHSQKILPDLRAGKLPRPRPEAVDHFSQGLAPMQRAQEPETQGAAEHGSHSGAIASRESPLAEKRSEQTPGGQDRRTDERRIEERRMETRRMEERRAESRRDQDSGPWQIENRPAADLLSAAHREHHGETGPPQTPLFATGTFGEDNAGKASSRVPWGTLAAGLLIVCAVLALWNVHRHKSSAQAHTLETPSTASAPSENPTTATNVEAPAPTSSRTSHSLKTRLENLSVTKPMPPAKSHALVEAAAALNHAAPNHAAPSHAAFTLLIRAEKNSWVSITADGKLVAEETLIAPAEKSVRASNQVVIKAGNSAGISFLLNAKEIPAQGKDGEVKTYVFDASGMKVSANAQPSAAD